MTVEPDVAAVRARHYLLSRSSDGVWTDFLTHAGQSDEWATAFVAVHLCGAGVAPSALQPTGAHLLARQRANGSWGYNATVPEDADSTAWVTLALLLIAPDATSEIGSARRFLARHRRAVGFATYDDADALRRYLGLSVHDRVDAWYARPHTCITAAVALAMRSLTDTMGGDADFALASLRGTQNADGSWDGYWWRTPMYPTAMAVEALATLGGPADRAAAADGVEWVARAQSDDGSWDGGDGEGGAFATGVALRVLAADRDRHASWERGAEWLLRRQRDDGAWDPCPMLQIPAPGTADPRTVRRWKRGGLGAPACVADQNRLFTTSVCCAALAGGAVGSLNA